MLSHIQDEMDHQQSNGSQAPQAPASRAGSSVVYRSPPALAGKHLRLIMHSILHLKRLSPFASEANLSSCPRIRYDLMRQTTSRLLSVETSSRHLLVRSVSWIEAQLTSVRLNIQLDSRSLTVCDSDRKVHLRISGWLRARFGSSYHIGTQESTCGRSVLLSRCPGRNAKRSPGGARCARRTEKDPTVAAGWTASNNSRILRYSP